VIFWDSTKNRRQIMKLTFGLAALALVAMPSFAMATGGCSYGKDRQAMTCAEGATWDSATSTCQPVVSS